MRNVFGLQTNLGKVKFSAFNFPQNDH